MHIFLDGVLLAIVILCIVLSVRRGFVKTALEFLCHVFGLFGVLYVAEPFSDFISKSFVTPTMENFVLQSVKKLLNESGSAVPASRLAIDQLIQDAPAGFLRLLEKFHVALGDLTKSLTGAESLEQARENAIQAIVAPAAASVSYVIAFVLCLIALIFLSKILIYVLDMVFHLPLLHQVNRSLGFVAGVFQGLFFAIVFANLVRLCVPLSQNFALWSITPEIIDRTTLFSFFYKINVIDYFRI